MTKLSSVESVINYGDDDDDDEDDDDDDEVTLSRSLLVAGNPKAAQPQSEASG